MRRTLATALVLLACTLTACGGSSDTAAPDTTTEATTPQDEATTTTEVEWTSAMQNACTVEADGISTTLTAYYQPGATPDMADLIDQGYLNAPPTHWTVSNGELVGIDANEDSRCGGIYLP